MFGEIGSDDVDIDFEDVLCNEVRRLYYFSFKSNELKFFLFEPSVIQRK